MFTEPNDNFLDVGSGARYKLENSNDVALHLKQGDEVKKEIQGQNIDIDVEIKEFLEKLVFAVNQPNEVELGNIIEAEMGENKDINLIDSEFAASKFQKDMLDWMKEKKGRFLTHEDGQAFFNEAKQKISKLVLIGPTLEYRAKVQDFGIAFSEDPTELQSFLTSSDKQIFNLISPHKTILGAIKIYQTLKDISEYQKDDSHIFIRLSSLLRIQDRVIEAFNSEATNNLLVIECKAVDGNMQVLYNQLSNKIQRSSNKKIILITQENNALAEKFKDNFSKYDKYEERRDEKNSLTDLTIESQEKLLKEGQVIFQGEKVSLGTLIDQESKHLINAKVLSKLIDGDEIKIGKALQDLGDVKDYYIPRTFNRQVKIKEDFKKEPSKFLITSSSQVDESKLQKDQDIVLISDIDIDEDFKRLCNKYKERNIHWLKKDGNEFVWQQSRGKLSNLRGFIDTESISEYPVKEITSIADKVVIISAEPGMGKSTVLTRLAIQTKAEPNLPALWIVRINLLDHASEFSKWKKGNIEINNAEAVKFLYRAIDFQAFKENGEQTKEKKEQVITNILELVTIENDVEIALKDNGEKKIKGLALLEIELFNYFYNQGKITLLFDGFDEISPDYKKEGISLLQTLKGTKVEKLWVTTRSYNIQSELEDKLSTFSHTLKSFLEDDQRSFLEKFWKKNLKLNALDKNRFSTFTDELLERFSKSINNQEKDFMEIPLQMSMIAEVFQDTFKEFYYSGVQELSDEHKQKLSEKLNLATLYERFIKIKFDEIRFGEKKPGMDTADPDTRKIIKKERKEFVESHRKLALYALLLKEDKLAELLSKQEIEEVHDLIENIKQGHEKTGIIDQVVNDKPRFIHFSFAEYFFADFLADRLSKHEKYELVSDFLYNTIVEFHSHRSLIPAFLDYKFAAGKVMHIAALGGDLQRIGELKGDEVNVCDTYGRTPLHLAAQNGHLDVVSVLLGKGANVITADKLFGWTPLHYAASQQAGLKPTIEIIEYFFSNTKDLRILKQVANAKDRYQNTFLFIANQDNVFMMYLLPKLLELDNFKNTIDGSMRFKGGKTLLHLYIESGNDLAVLELLSLVQDPNIPDDEGRTPLHYAANPFDGDIVQEYLIPGGADPSIRDKQGKTPLHMIIEERDLDISLIFLDKLLSDGKDVDVKNIIKGMNIGNTFIMKLLCQASLPVASFLLENILNDVNAQDDQGKTALHHTITNTENVFNFLISKSADANIKDNHGKTSLHYAIQERNQEVVKSLLKYSGAFFDDIIDNEGNTPSGLSKDESITHLLDSVSQLFRAVKENNINDVNRILSNSIEPDVIVNAKTKNGGRSPLHYAAQEGHKEIVEDLLFHGAFFNMPDNDGKTPLDLASNHEDITSLLNSIHQLFDAVEQGNLDEVIQCIDKADINFANYEGMQPLHLAVQKGYLEIVETLLKRGAKVNAKTREKATLFHIAVQNDHLEVIKALLDHVKQVDPSTLSDLINSKDVNGNAPLHIAVQNDNLEIVKVLLNEDADINVKTLGHDFTPLHFAAKHGRIAIANFLLERYAKLLYDKFQLTPIYYAIQYGHIEIVELLFKDGLASDLQNDDFYYRGMSLLHLAAQKGYSKIAFEILVHESLRSDILYKGRSPLHYAAQEGHKEIVEDLLFHGAFFNMPDNDGKTPLDLASNHEDITSLLNSIHQLFDAVEQGSLNEVMRYINEGGESFINSADYSRKGMQPLGLAAKNGHLEIVKYFLTYYNEGEVSFNTQNTQDDSTPISLAAQSKYWEIVILLLELENELSLFDVNDLNANQKQELSQCALESGHQDVVKLLNKGSSDSEMSDQLSGTVESSDTDNSLVQQIYLEQQKSFVKLNKYVNGNFPEVEAQAVKQGLYLPSFESRNIQINGKCAAITRMLSQELFLGQQVHESFLSNLQTSAELYERIAQGKQVSSREEKEIFALSRLLDSAEAELNSPTSSLPSSLSHVKSYKILEDLSLYVSGLTDDFAIHLVASNHVVAIYRTGDTYTYFDSNVALVSGLKTVDQLMKVVEKGVKYAGYEIAEEGFLVEHFDVTEANNALTTEQKEILENPIQTERHLLSLQDQEHGLIDVDGEQVSRVILYDMGAKLHAEGSAPILINSEMSSEDLVENLSSGKIKITAREYLENLKGNTKEIVQQKVSSLPFDGSMGEIKDAKTIKDLVLSEDGQMLDSYQLNKILKGPVEQSIKALPYYLEVANTKHWPNRLTNAAGRISMVKGYYDIAHSIRYGDTQGFLLGSGEIGFSLFSQLIEDGVVKVAPQVIKQMKHGIFLTRGFAGLITSPFDIYDLVSSSIDLANSKKGSKEWRDSIAGVAFSGTSVVTGVAFTALGKPGAGTVVGLGILIGQGLYSGTSMVIEYKKYKLTTNQEFRLFWHTFALQLPPEDVQYLAARKDVVNKLAEQAWEYLQNNTQVAAYGMGLGEIRFVDDTHSRSKRMIGDMEQSIIGAKLRNDIHIPDHQDLEEAIKELLPKPKEVKVEPSSSSIGMSSPSNERNGRNLSRIVPVSPSSEAEMLCLPQFTHRDYEYDNSFIGRKPVYTVPHSDFLVPHWDSGYGDSPALYSNSSTAIYHCHNAIIVGRKNDTMENPTMVFDLSLVNGNGLIVSSSKYNNQFNIAQGGTKIYGSNHTSNVFTLTDDNFFGRVSGGTANATNVLDVSQLKSKGLSYENNIVTTQEAQMTAENINHFIGRKAEAEHVDCQNMNNKIVIDSRGGNSGNSDVVSNCRKVIVTGNTKVVSNESDNTFYIKPSAGHAEIRGEGKGFVIFSDTALLQRASNISYSSTNNTLSIEIQDGTFILDVQNYLDKENNHNYLLIDKYGSVIEPIIQSNSTHFNLKAETNLTTRAEVAQRYQEISQVNGNYTVYGVVRDTARNNMIFGSEGSDVIPLTQNVTFAQGNEESDVYSLISCEKANVTINNYDEKKALDILYLPTDSIETNRVEDDLHIATGNVTANIKVENFFRNSSYRHLTIIDKDKNTFLPWPSKQSYVQLVPFFHATKGQYMFLLSAEKVQNNPEVIVDAKLDDIRFYRYGNDLMLMDDQPLIVKVENFYGNQYGNFTLNFRSKEKLSSKQLSELAKIAINYQDEIRSSYYDSFREYRMSSFNSTIHHNQRFVNGSLTTVEPDDKRVGILLLKDPSGIEVSVDNNDLVFFAAQNNATFVIKNWNDTDHRVSMLRFGQEDKSSIEVRKLDKFDLSEVAEIQAVINKAAVSNALDEQLEKLDNEVVNGLKYLLASNGIVNGINTYNCLGFDSEEDQQEFVAAYSTLYNKEKLKEVLQDSQVVEALRWLIVKGHTNLSLKDHDKEKHLLLKDLDQCFAAKDSFTIENWNHVSVLKFNQTIEVDLSEVSEIQHLISKYGITQLEELSDEEEFKYLLVGMDIRNGIYSCVAEKDTQKIYNPYYYEWLNWGLIKRLIDEKKVDANTKANDGNTILHEAASSGNLDIVEYLVDEKGVDVESRGNDGRTPIHHAAFSGSLDLVEYLVDEKEVDVTTKDNDGKTSLHYAAYSGNLDLVKYLVEEKSIGINTKDNYGNTILHEAASSNNLDLVKYLIDKGADVNAKTNGNWTSLHKAAEKGHKEVALALLDEGADINAKTIGGWTALHWAVSSGNKKTILALLNKGANINARTDGGETPLHIAEQQGKREIVALLNHQNTREHQRSRRAIKEIPITNVSDDLELFVAQNNATPVMKDWNHVAEEKATSSAIRASSLINDLFGWVKGSIGGLFNSRAALPENNTTQSSLSQVDVQVNVDGTIMLLDLLIRKVTGQKFISSEDHSLSLLNAQGYALNITEKFEQVLNETAIKTGISVTNLNFNPVPVSSAIAQHLRSGNFSEISKTLYSSAKEACPEFKQTCKFLNYLDDRLKEVLAEKEVELLLEKQKPINVDTLSQVKPVLQEDKPKSLLGDVAIENSGVKRIR
ncbi:ankyrin repeat domain-containing protein [Wolbachia endosymbiont of Folsomia candida]|uniref:ankyrin repeat domain-containing protein n=1 Tax=Wolbachia endosymbiont of Folsomia candida TaxID=169402 RepID=UPI0013007ED8|nr:ankyrin repeat domain-containing protein [Wolbachia endosymbiont of Folsomia candida]